MVLGVRQDFVNEQEHRFNSDETAVVARISVRAPLTTDDDDEVKKQEEAAYGEPRDGACNDDNRRYDPNRILTVVQEYKHRHGYQRYYHDVFSSLSA